MRAYNIARHQTKPRTYVPNLAKRVRIPLNNNVIDIAHRYTSNSFDENRVHTYCVSTLLWCTVPTSYEQRAYNNARNRPKQRTYVPNLPGRARAPLNYNSINFKQRIRRYEN